MMPMRFCSHLVRKGWCAYGDECSFAHSFDELHPHAAQQEFDMADSWELRDFSWLIRGFDVFVFRFQGCLWRGPAPRHTCPSPMSMCASSSTSSLVLMRSRSRLLVASGSRVVSLCLSRCSGVRHPSALSWVPNRLPVSSRLCVGSGVVGAGGLASLSPFVGAE